MFIHTIFDPDIRYIYVLQGFGIEELENADYDIAVVDPDDSKLTESDLEKLHQEEKFILAYLSIGEAENYRDYWEESWETQKPSFLDDENPDWEGNYKVQYWDSQWQEIIFDKVDSITEMGYDGIYLDVIDAYSYYEKKGIDSAEEEMIEFVVSISERSKEKNRHMLIIPQNSEELVDNEDYLSAIDGIGREDLWYIDDRPQDTEQLEAALGHLKKVKEDHKVVLAISYPSEESKRCDFIQSARDNGFIPCIAKRQLNTIEFSDCY